MLTAPQLKAFLREHQLRLTKRLGQHYLVDPGMTKRLVASCDLAPEDTVIEIGDLKIILDSQSAPLLQGTEVEYLDGVQGSGFSLKNPQAKTTCGCGSSFNA